MRTTRIACVAVAVLLLAAPTAGAQVQQSGDNWNWRGAIAAGKSLEIRGISGSIRAEPASGSAVEVTAEKHGRRSDPASVQIEVVEHGSGITICAVYPGDDNECRPGGGHMNVRRNDVEVDFVARVPAGVAFDANNVNGDVEVSGLASRVDASTVNGSVTLETTAGEASGTTVNGGVRATVRGAGQGRLSFSTVNGSIDVSLASGISADFSAQTVNGEIRSDFPVTMTGRISPRRMRGQIGQGGRQLDLRTVNGGIRLHSLP